MIHKIIFLYIILTIFFYNSNALAQEKDLNTIEHFINKINSHQYKSLDSVCYYSKKIIYKTRINNDWLLNIDVRFKISKSALYFNDFDILKKNLIITDSIYEINKSKLDTLKHRLTYNNLKNYYKGFYYYRLNMYDKAIKLFTKTINSVKRTPDSLLTSRNISESARAYGFIAKMYFNEGKLNLSEEFYKKSIKYLKDNNFNEDEIYPKYNLLAEVLRKKSNYKGSNSYFLKTLKYDYKKNSSNAVITSTLNIIRNFNDLSERDSSYYYYNFLEKYIHPNSKYIKNKHEVYADLLWTNNDFNEAIKSLKKSLTYFDKTKNNYLNIAQVYNKIGKIHIKKLEHNLAYKNFNSSLNIIKKQHINSTLKRSIEFKTLKYKTTALNKLKKHPENLKTIDLAVSILDSLKPSFKTNSDKLFLIENAFPLFENGIEAAYQMFQDTKDTNFINRAFFYSEKSKSTLLLESLLSTQATSFANIPEALIEKESQLKAK